MSNLRGYRRSPLLKIDKCDSWTCSATLAESEVPTTMKACDVLCEGLTDARVLTSDRQSGWIHDLNANRELTVSSLFSEHFEQSVEAANRVRREHVIVVSERIIPPDSRLVAYVPRSLRCGPFPLRPTDCDAP